MIKLICSRCKAEVEVTKGVKPPYRVNETECDLCPECETSLAKLYDTLEEEHTKVLERWLKEE